MKTGFTWWHKKVLFSVILAAVSILQPLFFARAEEVKPTLDSCDGVARELPANVAGRAYRGQCFEGIEIWAWAGPMPARFGAKSENVLFAIVINRGDKPLTIEQSNFAIVSLDPKRPNDAARAGVTRALDPDKVAEALARMRLSARVLPYPAPAHSDMYDATGRYVGEIVSPNPLWSLLQAIADEKTREQNEQLGRRLSDMAGWVSRTAFRSANIPPGSYASGHLYFSAIKGTNPVLMYALPAWMDRGIDGIKLPIGDCIHSTSLPQITVK
jgi:hypothetical protein